MIGVAAWGKGFGLVSSIHIIGGVIAVGVFLLLIAIVGLIGAVHHHQVMLFFVSFDGRWFHALSKRSLVWVVLCCCRLFL